MNTKKDKIVIDYQQAVVNDKKIIIDYKRLRKINPEAARTAVLEYLKSNGDNVSNCAKVFGLTRAVVYDIITKFKEGNLADRSRAPKRVANRTPRVIEQLVVSIRQQQKKGGDKISGPKAISFKLYKEYRIDLPYGTIRGILRRSDKLPR